jgi:hypothetical protein
MVVRHDGGGGDRFRRVSVGVVVGSDEGGGALAISGVEVGRQEAAHVCTREEDNQAGPACR